MRCRLNIGYVERDAAKIWMRCSQGMDVMQPRYVQYGIIYGQDVDRMWPSCGRCSLKVGSIEINYIKIDKQDINFTVKDICTFWIIFAFWTHSVRLNLAWMRKYGFFNFNSGLMWP